jgi:hypothetical protein
VHGTYAPTPATGLLFTATEGGNTATITLNAGVTTQSPQVGVLDIEDPNATLTMTGFTPTNGTFFWTINQALGTEIGSFSVTAAANAVPEPASLAILGVGLLGLGFVANRKRS